MSIKKIAYIFIALLVLSPFIIYSNTTDNSINSNDYDELLGLLINDYNKLDGTNINKSNIIHKEKLNQGEVLFISDGESFITYGYVYSNEDKWYWRGGSSLYAFECESSSYSSIRTLYNPSGKQEYYISLGELYNEEIKSVMVNNGHAIIREIGEKRYFIRMYPRLYDGVINVSAFDKDNNLINM